MTQIGWNRPETLRSRVKIITHFLWQARTFPIALNSVIQYRQSALHHHRLAKEKKKVAFEQFQEDS